MVGVSVVITTHNDEKNIGRVLQSVSWADELLVFDLRSDDKTVEIAKKLGAKIVSHERVEYVELIRNLSISKASGEWILILDPDEEVSDTLAKKLQDIVKNQNEVGFIEIPRKNIIFGKWLQASGWWPDYNIRFFKNGSVSWTDEIHRPPKTQGISLKLSDSEGIAIVHHHYESISQFLVRLDRYTTAQAKGLKKEGYNFVWKDLISKPLNEFLSRFFAKQGYKDGLHGFVLSLLQAFSFLIMYLKVWEMEGFKQQDLELSMLKIETKKAGHDLMHWFKQSMLPQDFIKRFYKKAINKFL